ncbi:MAG: exodeoxyribonuclease VII large subunit [Chloroflexi bacterium]|nr:exodeoxyribonuclease VII large subunit [Chloroflexota bacterium]
METASAVYTVSQVAGYIREYIEANPALQDIWVTGEVANARRYGSGHTYFSLRDAAGSLQSVMFKGGQGADNLTDGLQVIAHGRVSYYTVRGDIQLYVDMVRPAGMGALQIAFERLKERLQAEGLFEPSRKRPLPKFPARIAVVTSPTGAVLQDILNILRRRYPIVEVIVVPTPVQGQSAAPGIVAALDQVNQLQGLDLAILARGGGSLEDIWAFNEESVARAIFSSRVPIVSAIGHETDVTIADFVADLRAPTPSAAAELVVPNIEDLRTDVREHARRISESLRRRAGDARVGLSLAVDRLSASAPSTLDLREGINEMLLGAHAAMSRALHLRRTELNGLEAQLRALSPNSILERGYAVVRLGPGGPIVTSAGNVAPGDPLEVTLGDGEVEATATSVRRR